MFKNCRLMRASIDFMHFSVYSLINCCCIVLFQIYDPSNYSNLVFIILLMFWSFVQIFVLCDSSERVTGRFDEIDMYNQCDWYLFPMRIQRFLPTVIASTQQSVVLNALGYIPCKRETFKRVSLNHFLMIYERKCLTLSETIFKVINAGFTYFLTFREFLK